MLPDQKKLIFNCMCALSAIDGELHPNEASILEKYSKKHKINISLHPLDLVSKEHLEIKELFNKSLDLILVEQNANEILFELFHHLNELAGADDMFHAYEEDLIKEIGKKIGRDIGIGRKSIEWDDRQKKVLNAASTKRLLISAPPGAGKTELVASKVLDMINKLEIEPSKILLISFTNSAVQEMRERILRNSLHNKFPYGIQLITIDKKAFKVNTTIREDFRLTGSYEKNLEDFLEIVQGKNYEFLEDWSELEHIFIDEAQDFHGLRKEICMELINTSSKQTGISIFGDQCQQIYPWPEKGKALTDNDRENLMDLVIKEDNGFEELELTGIHRSDNNELIEILEDMRADIYLTDDEVPSPMKKFKESEVNFLAADLPDNYLFLFRTNKEIINAAYSLIAANKPFRLKATGNKFPHYYKSWLSNFINYAQDNKMPEISIDVFNEFVSRIKPRMLVGTSKDIMWNNLKSSAAISNSVISIERLINQLGNIRKNYDFLNTEFGFRGPKLSTVHASKGTQEDNVKINNFWDKNDTGELLDQDEAKVVFVAISRAKEKVETMPVNNSSIKSARAWRKLGWFGEKNHNINSEVLGRNYRVLDDSNQSAKSFHFAMEVGLTHDYDPLSIVDINLGMDEALKSQEFLKALYPGNEDFVTNAKRSNLADQNFHIITKTEKSSINLGCFNAQVLENSLYIYKAKMKYFEEPMYIQKLRIIDVATYIYNPDRFTDEQNQKILKPFREKRVWLIPIIYSVGLFTRTKIS
tara:strand:- start:1560 stop:3833 length:2274 start_codon:yes stop_codon:yes gene_type:complete